MAQTSLMPVPKQQFFDANGKPLAGGKVYTYQPGTTTLKTTYTDSTGNTANANPVILDSAGMASIWLSGYYKIVLKDATDVQQWSIDNVSSMPNTTVTQSEWIAQNIALTYVNATQFSTPGDLTSTFQINRRIQATISAGTVYGSITASAYAAGVTTVTVSLDSGNLDAGLSAVYVGILAANNPSVPAHLLEGLPYGPDTGAADAYVVTTPSPALTLSGSYVFMTTITHANLTPAPTMNRNGTGGRPIKRPDGSSVVAGDLPLNWKAVFSDNGVNYYLLNPYTVVAGQIPAGTITGSMMANGTVGTTQLNLDKCRIYLVAAQSIGTTAKVLLDTASFDTNSIADVATNHRITPKKAGYYSVSAALSIIGTTATAGTGFIFIYKNGVEYSDGSYYQTTNTRWGLAISDFIYCNGTTDYIELYAQFPASTALNNGPSTVYLSAVGPF